jgi:hypothetical protein
MLRLWCAFLTCHLLDLLSTIYVLSRGGFEINPLASAAWSHGGWPGLAMLKLVGLFLAFLAWGGLCSVNRSHARDLLIFCLGLIVAVAVTNLTLIVFAVRHLPAA